MSSWKTLIYYSLSIQNLSQTNWSLNYLGSRIWPHIFQSSQRSLSVRTWKQFFSCRPKQWYESLLLSLRKICWVLRKSQQHSIKHLLCARGINLTTCNTNTRRCCICQLAARLQSGLVQLVKSTHLLCVGYIVQTQLRWKLWFVLSTANR